MSVTTEDGRHTIEFRLRGQRVHKRCPEGATKAEADALETKLRREIFTTRDLGIRAVVPLAGAIQKWLDEAVKGTKSERSRINHAYALHEFVGAKSLQELPDVADAYRTHGVKIGLKPATINRRLAVLKATAKFCWRLRPKIIDENLSPQVWMMPENNARHVYRTLAELRKILAKAETPEGEAWIGLAAYTGLRQSELLALQPDQVKAGIIDLGVTKNGEPRLVPIATPGLKYVKALPFTRPLGSLDWEWRRVRDNAGFKGMHYHDLRHSYASFLINTGSDMRVVGQLLGHKTSITTRRYTHLYVKSLKSAVAKIR